MRAVVLQEDDLFYQKVSHFDNIVKVIQNGKGVTLVDIHGKVKEIKEYVRVCVTPEGAKNERKDTRRY